MVETANHQQQHEHQHQQPPVSHPPPPLMPPLGAARGPAFPPAEQLAQLNYCIHSNPSWPQTVILAFQHYIVMLGSAVMIATILVPRMGGGPGDKARVIQSMLFMSGVNTLLQTLLGTRLPTVMGPSFAYLISVLGIINDFSDSNFTSEHQRFLHCIRAIQGALIVSSFINIILGYGRAWANLTRLFSPVVIVPVVCVVGLGLFGRGFPQLANCVEIGLPMLILLVLCQQYLRGLHPKAHSVLERFALLFCIAFVWVFAVILTVSGAYNNVGQQTKTSCRTDRSGLLSSAPWIRIPYPFQWGAPIFRASHVFGMMGAALVASAESTGTFYAAARLSGATAPPTHVLTRSIGLQGIGQLIEGIFGSAVGTTASVENVGLLGLTHVGSRRVIQISTAFMIFFSIFAATGISFIQLRSEVMLLVLLCTCLFSVSVSSLSPDAQILLAFKSHWAAVPSSITTSWVDNNNSSGNVNKSLTPCSWVGVLCNNRSFVSVLNLSSYGIYGTLGPELGSLTYLTKIDLSYNYFSGFIPPQLGNCSLLTTLDLSANSLSGQIPSTLGNLNRLLYFAAFTNLLNGSIPYSLFQIPTLEIVYLYENELSGSIPSNIGNLTQLMLLYVDTNKLSGAIPSSIGNCTNLHDLSLSKNKFSGALPGSLNQIQGLTLLDVSFNNLQGNIPLGGSGCRLMDYMDLSYNNFVGGIPPQLGNCTGLTVISAVSSGMTGPIPSSVGQLSKLTELHLSQNYLSGTIPPEFGQCKSLNYLELDANRLEGEIPSEFGMLSKLEKLYLFENRLTGEIPLGIWKIETLVELHLYSNQFIGEIPHLITELKQLKNFTVHNNRFSGIVPQGLGINSSLEIVDVTNNSFTGQIPPNLCFNKKLWRLTLGYNNFHGSIPYDIGSCATLQRLIFQHNNLSGNLPEFVNNSGFLHLDFNNNRFSGTIPSSLRNLTNITLINLSVNKLTGSIPPELGDLIDLQVLNISHNDFEGPLPSQLSNCKRLLGFDVSYNHLNGSISSSFRNMVKLESLDLSGNHFTNGLPPFIFDLESLLNLRLGGNLLGGEFPALIGSSAAVQRLNVLNLSSNGLSGNLPEVVRNFKKLEVLDVSCNNLTGTLDPLTSLHTLININVSYNLFTGAVPTTLMKLLSSSPSSFVGNSGLCANCVPRDGLTCNISRSFRHCDIQSSKGKGLGKVKIAVIALATSLFAVFVLLGLGYFFLHRRKLDQGTEISSEEGGSSLLRKVMEATENLHEKYIIGSGAHGTVYKVSLGPEKVYAVKKLTFTGTKEAHTAMVREIQTIGKIKHRNLVKLEDFWMRNEYGLILYNYMQNGSLYDVLHMQSPPAVLEWSTRYRVALGTAHGLAYLHFDTDPTIVHRDIKPMNILLDSDMEPHISDFGIAKILDQSSASNPTTTVQGTVGYIAPEIAFTTRKSKESDVYSYGVVLLELLSRKKPLDPSFAEGEDIVSWAASTWRNTQEITRILDPSLLEEVIDSGITEQVTDVLLVALRCTDRDPSKRPSMREVVKQLENATPYYRK